MANTAANVIIGKPLATGGVLAAPLLTALPVDVSTALNVAFVAVGYISDDGVTQTIDADTSEISAWGGDIVRIVQTRHKLQYKFTLLETSTQSLGMYYGAANVTVLAAKVMTGDLEHQEWVIEVRDGVKKIRIVIPDGQITDRGDISYKHDDAVGYEVTLTCYPDATGVKAYLYCA